MNINFQGIAPYLTDPFVLTGFMMLIFLGICTPIVKVRPDLAGKMLFYAFCIILILMPFSFWLKYNTMTGNKPFSEIGCDSSANIRLVDFSVEPIGENKLYLKYKIVNNTKNGIDKVWLGAALQKNATNQRKDCPAMYYNEAEDKSNTIKPGLDTYTRFLTIDRILVCTGTYQLKVQIWEGLMSDPKSSKLLGEDDKSITVQ